MRFGTFKPIDLEKLIHQNPSGSPQFNAVVEIEFFYFIRKLAFFLEKTHKQPWAQMCG